MGLPLVRLRTSTSAETVLMVSRDVGAGAGTRSRPRREDVIHGQNSRWVMIQFDPTCFDAFSRLLARPDPGDLPRRGHVLCCAGDPDRRATRLPSILMGWLQQRWVEELDGEELCRWAVQMSPQRRLPRDAAPAGFFGRATRALVPDGLMALAHVRAMNDE
jgi:hypothetical protein